MKRSILFFVCLAVMAQVNAQPGKTPVTKAPVNPFKNLNDSASYSLGISMAAYIKQLGIPQLNSNLVARAINDVLGNKQTLLDDNTANTVINRYITKLQEVKAKSLIDSGEAFLKKNKLKPGVITTASGLQYEIITQGSGAKPTIADTFVVNYRGTLLNGTEFDASARRGQPLTHPVNQVIAGWKEGIQLMSIGSKYKFYIPYNLGYGLTGNGPNLPGGAMLIFDIELLDIKKGQ